MGCSGLPAATYWAAGDRRTAADRVIIGRTPYFRRAEIFFPIALRKLTIGPACMRGRSE